MIFMNLGSRYISLDISLAQDRLLKSPIVRRITIFCIFYVATRDIMMSFLLLAAFIFVTSHLLHENSPLTMLPNSAKEGHVITEDEYKQAKNVVDSYVNQDVKIVNDDGLTILKTLTSPLAAISQVFKGKKGEREEEEKEEKEDHYPAKYKTVILPGTTDTPYNRNGFVSSEYESVNLL
jgi:hypothetical protein